MAQAGSMTFPALMPQLMAEWHLSAVEAGWIVGMYFAGYAVAVPLLAALTDRLDARPVVIFSALLAGLSVVMLGTVVEEARLAMLSRFLTGIGVAGVHMPGLGLLAARLEGDARRRGSAVYAACYAMGTAGSFLIAGLVAPDYGWRAAFVVSGLMAAPVVPLVALVGRAPPRTPPDPATRPALLDFRPVVRNREALAYIVAYAGNTWEVFGVRAWMVAFLGFSMAASGVAASSWNPAIVSAVSVVAGVIAGLMVAEAAVHHDRRKVVAATAIVSVLVALAIAATVRAPTTLIVALLVLHGATSYGDAPSISAGVVEAATPGQRGATLAVFAMIGFLSGLAAPLVVGVLLEALGGTGSALAWSSVFVTLSLGSLVAATAMRLIGTRR
jgi:MFS family permease